MAAGRRGTAEDLRHFGEGPLAAEPSHPLDQRHVHVETTLPALNQLVPERLVQIEGVVHALRLPIGKGDGVG